jgi:hypothetical protein
MTRGSVVSMIISFNKVTKKVEEISEFIEDICSCATPFQLKAPTIFPRKTKLSAEYSPLTFSCNYHKAQCTKQ